MYDYEKHGIPEDICLDSSNIEKYYYAPKHLFVNEEAIQKMQIEMIDNDVCALWSSVKNWTTVEASLLIAGLNPHCPHLFVIISTLNLCDLDRRDIDNERCQYYWLFETQLSAAMNYFFIFSRSGLGWEASPVNWIKYYQEKILGKLRRSEQIDIYAKNWLAYFEKEIESINQEIENLSDYQENPGRRKQQIEMILAVISALNFDPLQIPDNGKAKVKRSCLTRPLFTDSGFEHAWKAGLKAGYFRLANHEKFSSK